ncbi:MAG TPA: hypothetical protein VGF63_14340 [Solirubrobacteraceae bacterium]|jgi:hypothetical protein
MNEHEESTEPERDSGVGYPEDGQHGDGIDPREHAEHDAVPDDDAPKTSSPRDGDPSQATGNPKAAGGDG